MKRLLNKKFWVTGSADILGFLAISPCLIIMIAMLLGMVQLGSIKERLEYTAYLACRQAVVAEDKDNDGDYQKDAEKIAKDIATDDLAKSGLKFVPGSVKVELKLIGAKEDKNLKWEKGNYVQCTVSVKIKPYARFLRGKRSATIVMMIEKPASYGGSYPWFENV